MCTGKRLMTMTRSDFTSDFGDVGEIIFTAFKQVVDISPDYKGRAMLYSSRIQSLIESYQTGTPISDNVSFWRTLDVREWSKPDILSWVKNVAEEYKMAPHTASHLGEVLSNIAGPTLCAMSLDEFRTLDSIYGTALCHSLESLKIQDSSGKNKPCRPQGEMQTIEESS